jgi:CheY-like chemotaxis protein
LKNGKERIMANILVIDDTPLTHRLLDLILKKYHHTSTSAYNGQEALELLKHSHFDMAIVDILMPDMDGFSLIRKIRANERTREMPVAVMTASADPNMAELAAELGANAFLSQPFSSWEIKELVANCVQ